MQPAERCSRLAGAAPARRHLVHARTNAGFANGWRSAATTATTPGTTRDHRGPLPLPAIEQDHELMARATATVICACLHRRAISTALAGPTTYGPPGQSGKITVRAFVSPMCHDHPEWTSNKRNTQGHRHTPTAGQIMERNTWLRPPRERRTWMEAGRCASPQASKEDPINDNAANRTRVRAKSRVVAIRRHSRPEIRKAN